MVSARERVGVKINEMQNMVVVGFNSLRMDTVNYYRLAILGEDH